MAETQQSASNTSNTASRQRTSSNVIGDVAHSSDEPEDDDEFEQVKATDIDGGNDVETLVGISISQVQARLKSPRTPAAVKSQAIEAAKDYFDIEPDSARPACIEAHDSATTDRPSGKKPQSQALQAEDDNKQWRSSFVSAILGGTSTSTRARSSSGSSIIQSIRKRLPGMPSITLPRVFGTDADTQDSGPTENNNPRRATIVTNADQREMNAQIVSGRSRVAGSTTGPRVIRRATSDNSLYLKRQVTGLSQFDDYNAFSDVSEMVNSRFKAITDSFQDSTLRLPRFPGIGSSKPAESINPAQLHPQTGSEPTPLSQKIGNTPKTSNRPILKQALSRLSGDLVVLGGYRGSILREAQSAYRQLWVPIKAGVNLRKADLEVGLTREDELHMHEKVVAEGILSHIGPIDISRRLLKKIKHCPNVRHGSLRLRDYGYDWRLSPDLLSDRLIEYLEGLPCNSQDLPSQQRGAWVIAHSLGGLITRHAINRRPELFAGIVYAGTPQNCINVLGPLRKGDDVLFSSRVLTAQVNFTFRTSFALLPQDGRCFIDRETGVRYNVDFFDAKTWEDCRLSPCIQEPIQLPKQEKRSSIFGSLSEVMNPATKREPWFTTQDDVSESSVIANSAKSAAGDATDALHDAADMVKPDQALSPKMQDASGKQKSSIATKSTIPIHLAKTYLSHTLATVLKFKQDLSYRPELQDRNAYPPAGIMFAKNTPTVYGVFVRSREAIKYEDAFDDLAFAAGDGVVLASAAQLPKGYLCVKNGRIESDRGHVGLLGDLEGVGRCLNAVIDARQKGVGSGAQQKHNLES